MATETAETPQRSGLTYAEAGVNIDAGDEVVDLIKPILKSTSSARVLGRHGAFAGMFRLDRSKRFKRNWSRPVLVGCTDGVGTKVLLAAERCVYGTVGIDCVAMNVNDLIVQGAEPLFFLDYLGLSKLDPAATAQMITGVAEGCRIAGCALIGGECAEMPAIYKKGDFDIAGFCVGVVELGALRRQPKPRKGDLIIGLPSSGVHSNGYTLVRRIIADARLNLDQCHDELGGQPLGSVLLEPTRIYSKPIVAMLDHFADEPVVSGMAHITGGGLPGNVSRALTPKLDAIIDTTSWSPHPIFEFLQHHGGVDRAEMFKVFNMGIGYTLSVRPDAAKKVLKRLTKLGEHPAVIGHLTKGTGEVQLL